MPKREFIQITATSQADEHLEEVAKRLLDSQPAFREALKTLERGEKRHFAQLGGQYVRTGQLRQSLTGTSPQAIREIHSDGLTFGTSVYYAQFLTKGRREADVGQVAKRTGKSAVLVVQPKAKAAIVHRLADYVTDPYGDGPAAA